MSPEPASSRLKLSPENPVILLLPLPCTSSWVRLGSTISTCSGWRWWNSMPLGPICRVAPSTVVSTLASKRCSPLTFSDGVAPRRRVRSIGPARSMLVILAGIGRASLRTARPAALLGLLMPLARSAAYDMAIRTRASRNMERPTLNNCFMAVSSMTFEQGNIHRDIAPDADQGIARHYQAEQEQDDAAHDDGHADHGLRGARIAVHVRRDADASAGQYFRFFHDARGRLSVAAIVAIGLLIAVWRLVDADARIADHDARFAWCIAIVLDDDMAQGAVEHQFVGARQAAGGNGDACQVKAQSQRVQGGQQGRVDGGGHHHEQVEDGQPDQGHQQAQQIDGGFLLLESPALGIGAQGHGDLC